MNSDEEMLTAKQTRQRYGGLSDMSLWRWLRDPDLKFPKPMIINSRRYWRRADLTSWERGRTAKEAA